MWSPPVRRVWSVVLLFLGALAMSAGLFGPASASGPALACTCTQPNPTNDLAAYAEKADVVFSGTLTKIALGPRLPEQPNADRVRRYVVAVETVFAGEATQTPVRIAPQQARSACELDLTENKRYLFFVDVVEEAFVVRGQCSGTQEFTTEVRDQLDVLYPPTPEPEPEPLIATRTRVAEEDRIEFARLAAPGAALVIVGALGLAIVNRLGRDQHS